MSDKRAQLKTTNFDHEEIKASLIEFLESTDEFGDFNYEGSAINTIIDLLTRNTTYTAYLANMLANESFIDSAQLRQSIVSHAQKLSYTPRSTTAARTTGTIKVYPSNTTNLDKYIEAQEGVIFMSSVGNESYTFTTKDVYTLELINSEYYQADGIELIQGQLVKNTFTYSGNPIQLPNSRIDTSTIKIDVVDDGEPSVYTKATSIVNLSADKKVFFLSENNYGLHQIEFGRDILGQEPSIGSTITVSYIFAELNHANGLEKYVSASKVAGFSNVVFEADQPAWGGFEAEDKETIRFLAPKIYQAQDRALTGDDYIPLIQSEYPFIRSIITWGGEENDPPRYGNVFMSFILDEDQFLTQSVKDNILKFLKDRNVGSITPVIVDPEGFGMDVIVEFNYDDRLTNKTFNQIGAELKSIVYEYNVDGVNSFGNYFNDAYLIQRFMNERGVQTANIKTTVFSEFDVLRFANPRYNIKFENPIVEGSIQLKDFIVDPNGSDHTLYDQNGNLYITFVRDSTVIRMNVGTVDYDTGDIEFTANFLQDELVLRIYATPKNENFYVSKNKYVFINSVEYKRF